MNKELIEAIKNPPPERLAKIEYQSHFLQIIGISTVCIFLFLKGFWYIIFAFIFGVGISYSQGMTALQKYRMIKELVKKEEDPYFENDPSWTRRRSKIITSVMGRFWSLCSVVISVLGSYYLIGVNQSRLLLMILYPLNILLMYIIVFFYISYWISFPIYKRRMRV